MGGHYYGREIGLVSCNNFFTMVKYTDRGGGGIEVSYKQKKSR
jgi:hypothetical protein